MQAEQHMRRIKNFLQHAGFPLRSGDDAFVLLAQGGSDRKFYRALTEGGSFVVMTAPAFRYELRAFLDVGAYLQGCGTAVPAIVAHDDDGQLVLMEDIGDDSLYSLLQKAGGRGRVLELYRQVLGSLAELQMQATPRMGTCHYLKNRTFGYEALRWETDYFTECFLKSYCGIEIKQERELDNELHSLADVIAAEPRYFMHRDFQSKNIHFKDGRVRIIDFATATCGLLQYDLASLLKDAYAPLETDERQELLGFYMQELAGRRGLAPDPAAFTSMFHLAGLQRTMQALGAFAFLSMRKGKPEFARYIPAGLSALQEALALFPEYAVLGDLAAQAATGLKNKFDQR